MDYYWYLIWSLIANIVILISLLSPNIVFLIHREWFSWKKDRKVYILEGSSGSWDDYVTFIIGIYDSPEKREEGKRAFLEKLERIKKENPCPVSEDDVKKIENYEPIDTEKEEKYKTWKYFIMCDINNVSTNMFSSEVELNQTDLSNLKVYEESEQ